MPSLPPIHIDQPAEGHRAWLALAIVLIACLPAMLMGIAERLSTHTMENVALVTSQETWLRMHQGDSKAWLVSTNDGAPRLEKPPMLTWLNLLAWSGLDPGSASAQQLTSRARLVTVVLGSLMLASIFWVGAAVDGWKLGALAALIVGSTFFFQRQARTASYDLHHVAWTSLAVAAGLWAMIPPRTIRGPDRRSRFRRWGGWGLCAVGLSAAALSKNPLPYLFAVPVLGVAIALLSENRRPDSWRLTVATLVSAMPVAWWYWYVFENHAQVAEKALGREIVQPRAGDFQPVYYYFGLLGLVAPWTLWLIGGLIEPFKMVQGDRRRFAKFCLIWFGFIFVVLSIPAAKQQRYILAIMPAVGLLTAMFLAQHQDRARRGTRDRLFEQVSAGTWIALAFASVIAAALLAWPQQIALRLASVVGQVELPLAPMRLPSALAVGLILLTTTAFGWRWRNVSPRRSAAAMAAWMLVLMTAYWRQEARRPAERVQVFVEEAARVRNLVGSAPLHSLRWVNLDENGYEWKVNEEFRFYLGRLIPRIPRDGLDAWVKAQPQTAFLLVRPDAEAAAALRAQGLQQIGSVLIDKDDRHELWRLTP